MYKKRIIPLLLMMCLLFSNAVYAENTDSVQADSNENIEVSLEVEEISASEPTVLPTESIQPTVEKSKEVVVEPIADDLQKLTEMYGVDKLSEEDIELLSEYPQTAEEMFPQQLASMNYPRAKFQTVNVNGMIYAIGGVNDDGIETTVERYSYKSNTWEVVTQLPYEIRDFAAAAIGNNIYIAGGYVKGEISNRVYAYNTLSDLWTEKASMHDCRTRHNLINADGLLYAVGGRNDSGTLKSVETYNFSTNRWTKITDINTARMDSAIAYGSNKIFVIGGFDEKAGYIGGCEYYDLKTKKWTDMEGIGNVENMYTRPNALVYGTEVYVYWKGADPIGYIWQSVYDMERDSWSEPECTWLNSSYFSVSTVEYGICILGGFKDEEYTSSVNYKYIGVKPNIEMKNGIIKAETVCIGDEIYTIGGALSTGVNTKYISKYSNEQYKWINVTSMPTARRGFSAETIGNTIYIIGGYCNDKYEREVLAYDVSKNQWSVEATLPEGMERMATTIANDKLYIIGGRRDSKVLNTMYQYDFSTKEWTTLSNTLRAGMDFGCEILNGKLYLIGGKDSYLPLNYIDEYDIETNQWTNKHSDLPAFEYLKTVLHDDRIVIVAQNAYDGTENVIFKEYLPNNNTVIDSTLSSKFNNIWYGLASNNTELWLIGGYDGKDYSNIINVINDSGQSEVYNSKTVNCTQDKLYDIYIYGSGINSFKDKVFVIKYDANVLSVEDLCAFTPGIDRVKSNQYIKGTDILIKNINQKEGTIEFTIDRIMPQYSIWEGNINVIRFKALRDGDTRIKISGAII